VSEYYGTPVGRMPAWIDPDELPLVYLLAREAGVSPQIVIALREQGWSWVDITYELGVDPYMYVERLPYSTGYWRRYSSWEIRYLTDRHIIDYVNLIFWADYHRRPVTQVIVIRQRVPSWRHYVRYYTPPRTVARGVYVDRRPSRSTRDVVPRQAVPRDDSQRRAIARDGRATDTRATPPSRSSTGVRPTDGVRRDPAPTNGGDSRPAQGVRREPGAGERRRFAAGPGRAPRTGTGVRRDVAAGSGSRPRPVAIARHCGTVVAEHGGTVAEHRGTVAECGTVAGHGGPVAKHCGTVAKHCGTVAEHGGTVAEHSGTVAEHSGTVAKHSGEPRIQCFPRQRRSVAEWQLEQPRGYRIAAARRLKLGRPRSIRSSRPDR
jgi:hypothetical protein